MLTERVTEARQLYLQAARKLGEQSGTNFEVFYQHAEQLRRLYESARDDLSAHTKEHGCSKL